MKSSAFTYFQYSVNMKNRTCSLGPGLALISWTWVKQVSIIDQNQLNNL